MRWKQVAKSKCVFWATDGAFESLIVEAMLSSIKPFNGDEVGKSMTLEQFAKQCGHCSQVSRRCNMDVKLLRIGIQVWNLCNRIAKQLAIQVFSNIVKKE